MSLIERYNSSRTNSHISKHISYGVRRLRLCYQSNETQPSMMEEPGQKLKRVRERLNLRYREVEVASTEIAQRRGNDEFIVALSHQLANRLSFFEFLLEITQ